MVRTECTGFLRASKSGRSTAAVVAVGESHPRAQRPRTASAIDVFMVASWRSPVRRWQTQLASESRRPTAWWMHRRNSSSCIRQSRTDWQAQSLDPVQRAAHRQRVGSAPPGLCTFGSRPGLAG